MSSEAAHDAIDPAYQSDVSVLGLGAMGSRMALALLSQGKRVSVWNRSAPKAEELAANGAHRCDTAEEALLASPISIVVLLDHHALRDVFGTVDQGRAFRDRLVVNFTTLSAEESEHMGELICAGGGNQVRAAIVAYPRNIGHPESYAIYSGSSDHVSRHSGVLGIVAPNSVVLPTSEAHALSVALHVYAFAAMTAFYEAVAAGHHFGVPPARMARLVSDASRFFVADAIEDATRRLEISNFAGDQARLDVHASAFEYLADAMHRQGAAIPVFDAVCQVTQRASEMGHGEDDIAAMIMAYAPGCVTGSTSAKMRSPIAAQEGDHA